MGGAEARRRFAAGRVARLATVTPHGSAHLVPVTFALEGDTLFSAVDAKPKRTRALQRLVNVAANPQVSLLVDHYDDDWSALWWVRADGLATLAGGADESRALELLCEKYEPYRTARPEGPVVRVEVRAWRWWSARELTQTRARNPSD